MKKLTFIGKILKGGLDWFFSCYDKQIYSEKGAIKTCLALKNLHNRDLEPYKCRHCVGWHVGHKPGTSKRGIEISFEGGN